jgi:tetratricopeptide (TPR) repeat protein
MTPRRSSVALLCLVLGAPAACQDAAKKGGAGKSEKASAADDSKPKKKSKGDDDDDKGDEKAKKKSAKSDDEAKDDDDAKPEKKPKAGAVGFDDAMKRARDLVAKKDYRGAVAAYDDACDARDDDALPFGERGYAKVLDKQYDAGLKDLDAAVGKTDDAKLLGPIWYNIGLAREGKSDKKGALAAFKKSNELRPTKAAANKIAALGDTATIATTGCPAKVDARHVAAKKYASWLELYKALAKKDGVDAPDTPPTSDAAALKLLCKDGCSGKGPFLVRLGGVDSGGGAEVIALAGEDDAGKIYA